MNNTNNQKQILSKKRWKLPENWLNPEIDFWIEKSLFIQAPGSVVFVAEAENLAKAIRWITTEAVRLNNKAVSPAKSSKDLGMNTYIFIANFSSIRIDLKQPDYQQCSPLSPTSQKSQELVLWSICAKAGMAQLWSTSTHHRPPMAGCFATEEHPQQADSQGCLQQCQWFHSEIHFQSPMLWSVVAGAWAQNPSSTQWTASSDSSSGESVLRSSDCRWKPPTD